VRAEQLPAALVIILAGLITAASLREARHRRARHAEEERVAVQLTADDSARGVTRKSLALEGAHQAVAPAELRRRVANLAAGTYVDDMLAEQDSVLYRWPERLDSAVRVYIEPSSTAADWSAAYPGMAREVFGEWAAAGFPIRFTFIYDSTSADISIRWLERYSADAGQRIGETERVHSADALIQRARIEVANHDSAGHALSAATVTGAVRHEVGHALGLNHAKDPSSVMYRQSGITTIGASDRATLRLLYLVPAGSLRD